MVYVIYTICVYDLYTLYVICKLVKVRLTLYTCYNTPLSLKDLFNNLIKLISFNIQYVRLIINVTH